MTSADPAKSVQLDGPPAKAAGLRERKKQRTSEAIQRAAMRLFLKQGYEETTIEEIAAAVEISPSTFFNYFPTKEDVVLLDIYDPLAIALFQERPKDEPLNVVVRRVLDGLDEVFQRDRELIMARARLILEVPALRGRIWDELERTQAFMTMLLAERTGRDRNDYELRVTVRVMLAAIWEASVEWMRRHGRRDFAKLAHRALDVVESGARLSALARPKPHSRRPR